MPIGRSCWWPTVCSGLRASTAWRRGWRATFCATGRGDASCRGGSGVGGAGPKALARHGYSRDGKPHNVQVIVGVVMVSGWPIAHHVWEGNRLDHTTVQEVLADLQKRFTFGRVVGDRGRVTEKNVEQCGAGLPTL